MIDICVIISIFIGMIFYRRPPLNCYRLSVLYWPTEANRRPCLVRKTHDRSILWKTSGSVSSKAMTGKKSNTDNERVDENGDGGVGKEKNGKRNYARNRKCWSRWELRGIVPTSFSFPFLVVLFCLSSYPFFLSLKRKRKEKRKERAQYIQHVYCVGILRDVVSWWITYFAHFYRRTELVPETCIHSTADGRNTLPRWITSIYPHKRSINLYIDGFDGIPPLRKKVAQRSVGKKFQTKMLMFNVTSNLYFLFSVKKLLKTRY